MTYDDVKTKNTSTIERILAARDLKLPNTDMTPEMEEYIEQMREHHMELNGEAMGEGAPNESYREWLLKQYRVAEIIESHGKALKRILSH